MSYHFVLKDARRKSGLSLRKAAAQMHLNPSTLYRYEEGLILNIPFPVLLTLYRYYHISFIPVLPGTENTKKRCFLYCHSINLLSIDILQQHFLQLDARGRKTIYKMLLSEEDRVHKKTADFSTDFSAAMPLTLRSDR